MNIQLRGDKAAMRVNGLPDGNELTISEATDLINHLAAGVRECGHELKIEVEVPRHKIKPAQLEAAVIRVGHLRRQFENRPWNDGKVNAEIVQRVLEACL